MPGSFVSFCERLGVELTPAQRVSCRVAFDRVQPADLPSEERALAASLFGPVDRIPPACFTVIVAVCGARAGKSYVLVSLRLLHLALTVDLSTLAPGEVASCPIFCPDMDLAAQDLNYVKGAIASSWLASSVVHDTNERVSLRRDDGRLVEVVVRAASARGRTARGRSLPGGAMDECALFRDANYQVNDDEIFKGLSPRVMVGGQLIVASTPWAEVGLLYDMHRRNHGHPIDALSIHAPTLTFRDTPQTRAIVAREEAKDAENARREFGAEFMASGAETFFSRQLIESCVDKSLDPLEPRKPKPGETVTAGGDLGFTTNSSALAVAHRVGNRRLLAELLELKPQPSAPLKPSGVMKAFVERLQWHGASYFMGDGHYRETAVEHLVDAGLGFIDGPTMPAEAFIRTRQLMRNGQVGIPDHARLIAQLKDVRARRNAGGTITILQPKKATGEHGDLVSAFVLAMHQLGGEDIDMPAATGPDAEAAAIKERRRQRVAGDDDGRPWWERATG